MNKMKNFQLTLAILKPDVSCTPHALKIIKSIILKEKFLIADRRVIRPSKSEIENFYGEHKNKFFYNRLTTFMVSGPLEVMILGQNNAIKRWREVLGPTKVFKTHLEVPDSIRGMIGLSDTRNAAHGSDSIESAEREIKFFFPNFSYDRWNETGRPVVDLMMPDEEMFAKISFQDDTMDKNLEVKVQ